MFSSYAQKKIFFRIFSSLNVRFETVPFLFLFPYGVFDFLNLCVVNYPMTEDHEDIVKCLESYIVLTLSFNKVSLEA